MAGFKSLPTRTKQLLIIGGIFALLVSLPLFIWAIVTQRFDIRKSAFKDTGICWNRVIEQDGSYFWPDACGSTYVEGIDCAAVLTELSADEKTTYESWKSSGQPYLANCGMTAPEPPTLPAPNEGGGTIPEGQICTSDTECVSGLYCVPQQIQCITEPCNPIYVCSTSSTGSIGGTRGGIPIGSGTPIALGTPIASTAPEPPALPAPPEEGEPTPSPSASTSPTASPVSSAAPTPASSTAPEPPTLPAPSEPEYTRQVTVRVRLAGVTDGSAEGAKARLTFVNTNPVDSIDLLETSLFSLTHVGNGLYEAIVSLTPNLLRQSPGWTISVKAEKHVATKFCERTNQSTRCIANQRTIELTNDDEIFNFTGIPLEPGDLPPQDGRVDVNDFAKITSRMNKLCSSLTQEDKDTADVDYSGCINVRDAFLVRQTLQTKYDEF